MDKKFKPITKKKEKTKEVPPSFVDPEYLFAWREIPITDSIATRWADEMTRWITDHPEAKTLTEFYYAKGINHQTWTNCLKKFPVLADAHEAAKRRLGERLWGKCVENKANWNAVKWMLQTYGKEYDDAARYHADLAKREDQQPTKVDVHMIQFPDTKIPEKDKK